MVGGPGRDARARDAGRGRGAALDPRHACSTRTARASLVRRAVRRQPRAPAGGPTERPGASSSAIDPKRSGSATETRVLRVVGARLVVARRLRRKRQRARDPADRSTARSRGSRSPTGLTYVQRGGSGAVVYTVSEPTVRDGVRVGDAFFRGFRTRTPARRAPASRSTRFPTDSPAEPAVRVVAEDEAGNVATAGWPVVVQERRSPTRTSRFPRASSIRRSATSPTPTASTPADPSRGLPADQHRAARARTRRRSGRLAAHSAPKRLWDGPLRRSSPTRR